MANAYTNYNQNVYMQGVKLKGVNNISFSSSANFKSINILGSSSINQITAGAPQANVSVTRDLSFVDLFQNYTGINRSIRGSLLYGNRMISFNEGHLTSYSYSVDYGQTPVSTLGITVYGNLGSGDPEVAGYMNYQGSYQDDSNKKIVRPSDISVSCHGSTSNRVKNFSVDVNVPKLVAYAYGDRLTVPQAVQISIGYPVEVTSSFTMEVDDYQSKRVSDYLINKNFDAFSINVKGIVYDENVLITAPGDELTLPDGTFLTLLSDRVYQISQLWSFSSSNTKIISQDFSSSVDDISEVKISYKTLLNNPNNNTTLYQYL